MQTLPKFVGESIRRREDPALITGVARYVNDVQLPGMLHLKILRSPYAHAEIRSIRVDRAEQHPEVVATMTGERLKGRCGPLPTAPRLPQQKTPERYPLAISRVRFVGEAVAAVVTTTPYAGEDAVELIEVHYEPLPVVIDPEEAIKDGGPVLHPPWTDNRAFQIKTQGGDVERAFREADVVVRQRLVNQRLIPMAMEPRGVVAQFEQGTGQLTVWTSTQVPHIVRTNVAGMLNLSENHVRVVAPEVGGGFGSKLDVYPEEALTAFMAVKLGRPVKWIETRMENFQATTHGRDQVQYAEIAARRDGTILAMRVRVLAEMGAYLQLLTPGIPTATTGMLPGVYAVPNVEGELIGVFTNKTPTGAYRGAGRPESTYCIERMVDLLARELGMDPAELRRRNFIAPEAFPYVTATGNCYDSGNYALALEKALELADYAQLRKEQGRKRQEGKYMGIGLSTYVEVCGAGPSRGESLGGWERGTVRIGPTCKVSVSTGTSPHGQGTETSFAQLVADELSVPLDSVVVLHGDTATSPDGIGTFGSRGTVVGGSAVMLSARKLRNKILAIASHLLEAALEDLLLENQHVLVRGSPHKSLTLQEIIKTAYRPVNIPPEIEPGMEATTFFEPPDYTYPFGAHVAVVEVDPETGVVSLKRFIAIDDCGCVINPMLVEGQIHGGLAQGIAQALYEGVIYDENGQLLTGSLNDYAVPVAHQLISFDTARTETPTPVNPLGAKGAGEAGTIGSPPAIVNAVMDALAPFDIRHLDMPLTPEKIWRAIQGVQ